MSINVQAYTIELGDAIPSKTSTLPSLVSGLANLTNAPTATGVITYPQSPSGTSITNTGRPLSATQAYMAASLNAQNQKTTPTHP